jgi:Lar family restriction alleviation protein
MPVDKPVRRSPPKHIRRPIGTPSKPDVSPAPKRVGPDPCPFCGSATVETRYTRTVYAYVVCVSCEAQGPVVGGGRGVAGQFAVEAWNRRGEK